MSEQPSELAREQPPSQMYEFEGAAVTACEGRLPQILLDMPEGYVRDTHLRMIVEVRVRSIRYEEDRKGDLVRQHVFALESVALVAAYQPEQARDDVAGSASTAPTQTPEQAAELGLDIHRTGQLWQAS